MPDQVWLCRCNYELLPVLSTSASSTCSNSGLYRLKQIFWTPGLELILPKQLQQASLSHFLKKCSPTCSPIFTIHFSFTETLSSTCKHEKINNITVHWGKLQSWNHNPKTMLQTLVFSENKFSISLSISVPAPVCVSLWPCQTSHNGKAWQLCPLLVWPVPAQTLLCFLQPRWSLEAGSPEEWLQEKGIKHTKVKPLNHNQRRMKKKRKWVWTFLHANAVELKDLVTSSGAYVCCNQIITPVPWLKAEMVIKCLVNTENLSVKMKYLH